MLSRLLILLFFVPGSLLAEPGGEAGRYQESEDYLRGVFAEQMPPARTLWVTGDLRDAVERTLGHDFSMLRVRYWYDGSKSAWILDEIGKELPITIGVTVANGAIDNVRVLEFRESRGWEVRYPFFTEQFVNVRLGSDQRLDRNIDGISGATLSVRAVTRIAQIALQLHGEISDTD